MKNINITNKNTLLIDDNFYNCDYNKFNSIPIRKFSIVENSNENFDETIQLPISGSEEEQIRIVTQSMADNFAKRIQDSPVDWHMLQRIWVDEEN